MLFVCATRYDLITPAERGCCPTSRQGSKYYYQSYIWSFVSLVKFNWKILFTFLIENNGWCNSMTLRIRRGVRQRGKIDPISTSDSLGVCCVNNDQSKWKHFLGHKLEGEERHLYGSE